MKIQSSYILIAPSNEIFKKGIQGNYQLDLNDTILDNGGWQNER